MYSDFCILVMHAKDIYVCPLNRALTYCMIFTRYVNDSDGVVFIVSSWISVPAWSWLLTVSFCICLPCVINIQMFFFPFSLFVEIIEPTTTSPVSSPGQYPHTSLKYVWVLFLTLSLSQEWQHTCCHIRNYQLLLGSMTCDTAVLSLSCLCEFTVCAAF